MLIWYIFKYDQYAIGLWYVLNTGIYIRIYIMGMYILILYLLRYDYMIHI